MKIKNQIEIEKPIKFKGHKFGVDVFIYDHGLHQDLFMMTAKEIYSDEVNEGILYTCSEGSLNSRFFLLCDGEVVECKRASCALLSLTPCGRFLYEKEIEKAKKEGDIGKTAWFEYVFSATDEEGDDFIGEPIGEIFDTGSRVFVKPDESGEGIEVRFYLSKLSCVRKYKKDYLRGRDGGNCEMIAFEDDKGFDLLYSGEKIKFLGEETSAKKMYAYFDKSVMAFNWDAASRRFQKQNSTVGC